MMNITPPPALHGDEQAKLTQIYRYLFRLSESLNATAATIDSQAVKASEAVAKAAGIDPATVSADVGGQYTSLVSLVVKTANIVQSQMDKIVTTLNSKYKASGEFGELTEEVRRLIEETAKHTIENYQYGAEVLNIPEMAADFEAYKIEAEGYIKRGIIDYDKDGFPVFGIAIGQELKSREVTIDGVVYTEFDTTKNMATYTAEKLSFWIDGVEVAYLSQSELVVTRIIVSDSIQLGDWDIKVNAQDGLTIQQQIGNEIVTASQINMVADQIDLSGNKSIKLTAEQINAVANEIDLSGNKSIKLTAEQINAVAGQIDLTSNKSITMLAGEVDNLDRLSNIEVIEGTFAQVERREGEGIRIYSEIGPKQDLSKGDLYPGGGGKNLWNNSASALGHSTTKTETGFSFVRTTSGGSYVYYRHPLRAGDTVTFSAKFDNYVMDMYIYEKAIYGTQLAFNRGAGRITYTANADYPDATFAITIASAQGDCNVSDIQIEYSNAVTSYAPYANTPPIEGWTGLNAFAGGKNLCELVYPDGGVVTENADGTVTVTNNSAGEISGAKCVLTGVLPAGTYTISKYDSNANVFLQTSSSDYSNNVVTHTFNYDGASFLRVVCSNIKAGESVTYKIQIERGSTATPYAPYQGNTYFLDFGETVYGGKVDWHAGEMTVGVGAKKLTGTEAMVAANINDGDIQQINVLVSLPDAALDGLEISSAFPNIGVAAYSGNKLGFVVDSRDLSVFCIPKTTLAAYGDISDGSAASYAAAASAYFAANDVQIVYKLAEPYTIQITPVQIETLQGLNTVYTDADGGRVEFGHSHIEDIQNAVDALEEAQAESALYLKLDAENKVVRIGQTEVTSEFDIDAYGAGVVVGGKSFSRLEGERVLIGGMEMRKPANIGGLAFDSIMT